jgi:hypothetical protein
MYKLPVFCKLTVGFHILGVVNWLKSPFIARMYVSFNPTICEVNGKKFRLKSLLSEFYESQN